MRPTIVLFSIFALFLINQSFAQGGWQWAASHGGDVSSPTEVVKHLQTDQWGNVYIAGSINDIYQRDSAGNILYGPNFFPLIHNYGQSDIWIAKYSPTGKKLWQEYAGSGGRDGVGDFVTDKDGNTYLIGFLSSHLTRPAYTFNQILMPIDSLGTFIAKLDSGGTLQWHRTMGFDTIGNMKANTGGAGLFLKDNKLLVFLNVDRRKVIFNAAIFEEGWYAVEIDLNGNYLSKTKFPFIDYQRSPTTFKTAIDNQGNYYFHGQFPGDTLFLVNDTLVRNSQNIGNSIVLSIDSSGSYKWSFITNNNFDSFTDGIIKGDTFFAATDISSFQLDTVSFGNLRYRTGSNTFQESAIILIDLDNGSVIGLKHNNGTSNLTSRAYGIAANADFMAISGKFNHKMTFSGTTDYLESISRSSGSINSDAFFALFDRQGNYLCEDMLYTFGSVDGIQKMTFVDSSIYVAGFFNDTLFVQGDTLIASGSNDVFLARYDLPCDKGITVGIKENSNFIKAENGVLVYPNPSNGFTNLIGKPVNNTALIIDIKGTVVKTIALDVNSMQQPINLQEVKSGVYFLTIIGNKGKQVLKLIRE